MTIEIKAPTLPESVPDGTIATWYKKVGDAVERDELLVDIETDKVVIEVVSPTDGVLQEILQDTGDTIVSNQAIGTVVAGEAAAPAPAEAGGAAEPAQESSAAPSAPAAAAATSAPASPAAKKMIAENNVDPASVSGSGKAGRITKEDVASAIAAPVSSPMATANGRVEERVPMSRLRAKVAERLLHASQSTAMLTTFNEVNMAPVMEIRNRYKQEFEKTHDGVRLGFMSFFVRACTEALKALPCGQRFTRWKRYRLPRLSRYWRRSVLTAGFGCACSARC
jgi:2-oxoglutarate dehydrogenase E2 component (dihydrolipoamide succinyltransferase)